ncbi:MAG: hypothetical protein ACKOX3_05745 [Bacteroidota bacterium]
MEVSNKSAKVEHEATTSKVGEDQIFYCKLHWQLIKYFFAVSINN